MQPKAGYTYRVFYEGKESALFHCTRVHGRRIDFAWSAKSALYEQTTRTRWRKMVEHVIDAGGTITEELTDESLCLIK